MLQKILDLDSQLFLYLNSFHFTWLDGIMETITRRETWFPAYLFLIIWLIYIKKKQAAFVIISIILAVLMELQWNSTLVFWVYTIDQNRSIVA